MRRVLVGAVVVVAWLLVQAQRLRLERLVVLAVRLVQGLTRDQPHALELEVEPQQRVRPAEACLITLGLVVVRLRRPGWLVFRLEVVQYFRRQVVGVVVESMPLHPVRLRMGQVVGPQVAV